MWQGLLLLVCIIGVIAQDRECTKDDYNLEFTMCGFDQMHDLIAYKKAGVVCSGGVQPEDLHKFEMPCGVGCGNGLYQPFGERGCWPCMPGTYSIGGAYVWDDWHTLPDNMGVPSLLCTSEYGGSCSTNWELNGKWLSTSSLSPHKSAIFQLNIFLQVPGHITFLYRDDANPGESEFTFQEYGNAVFTVDQINKNGIFHEFSYPLSSGGHSLRWVYKTLDNPGSASAQISYLELSGVEFAAQECIPCPMGHAQPNVFGWGCDICPYNTFAPSNSSQCFSCPPGESSYAASSSCSPKRPCTTDDYTILIGTCNSAGRAMHTPEWLDPIVCNTDAFTLPNAFEGSCDPCDPGQYRTSTGRCEYCIDGYYSNGTVAICSQCPSGYGCIKQLHLTSTDSFSHLIIDNHNTWCEGECGTPGWRNIDGHIDSGSGHGSLVTSTMAIQVPFVEDQGFLIMNFQFFCHVSCSLVFNDVDEGYTYTWLSTQYPDYSISWSNTAPFSAGMHNFTFSFYQNIDPVDLTDRHEMVRITSLNFIGTQTGGASFTFPCPDGKYSDEGTENCELCQPGFGSSNDHSTCVPCSGNTFNPVAGGSCIECGAGTLATNNHLSCSNDCTAVFNNKFYQVSDLFSSSYITAYDSDTTFSFYFNPCKTDSLPYECRDSSDNIFASHGCAVRYYPEYLAKDVGSLVSYLPLPDNGLGVRVQLNQGASLPDCSSKPVVTIDLICNPMVTWGSLKKQDNYDPCNPSFELAYLDACPLCTVSDYRFYYTECYNSTRTKVYQWREPTYCHGGVILPSNEVVTCSSNTRVCEIGYALNAAGDGCVLCDAGGYSLGGGYLVNEWDSLPDGFRTQCTSAPCTKWSVNEDYSGVLSGYGTSSLVAVMNYKRIGAVVFTYQLFSTGVSQFQFYLDGVLTWSQPPGTNKIRPTQQRIAIPQVGTHELKWTFQGGSDLSALDINVVDITQIFFENVDYHADACSPCPAGSRPSIVSVEPSLGCTLCARNTYAAEPGYEQCLPCPEGTHQPLPGQDRCFSIYLCSLGDYKIAHSNCYANGTRLESHVLAEPVLCTTVDQIYVPPSPKLVPCAPCPPFSFRNNQGACVGCPSGQHYNTAQQKCVAVTTGGIVRRTASYFYDGYYPAILPAEFTTGCEGECFTPLGWRVNSGNIDSGRLSINSAQALDSFLIFSPTLAIDGTVTFNFSFYTSAETTAGIYFFVDGLPYPLNLVPAESTFVPGTAEIHLSKGTHKLEWNIHQTHGEAQFLLSNLAVVGSTHTEAASEYLSCPPGTYSRDPTDLACTPCAAGHFNPNSAATSCTPCAINTYSSFIGASNCTACEHGSYATSPGAQNCVPNCQFQIGSDSYSLLSIQPSVTVYDTNQQRFDISVCGFASNCVNSHVCVTNSTGAAVGSGSSFRVAENNDNNTYSNSPFSVFFENGAPTSACPTGTSALVDFECNPFASASVPVFVTQDECTSIFFWQSLAACHICTDADYQVVEGSCVSGKRYVSKTLIRGCNGPTSIPVTTKDCSAREIPTGAIVAIVIIFVALVALAVGIFIRNRSLYSRYSKLLEGDRFSGPSKEGKEKEGSELGNMNSAVL